MIDNPAKNTRALTHLDLRPGYRYRLVRQIFKFWFTVGYGQLLICLIRSATVFAFASESHITISGPQGLNPFLTM